MKILAFSYGDPKDPKTWSGVPYYSIKALEAEGHVVRGYSIKPGKVPAFFVKYTNKALRLLLGRQTLFTLEMMPFFQCYYLRKVKKALKRETNYDFLLYYSFSIPQVDECLAPTVYFCDFTIEYAIHEVQKRQIKWYEQHLVTSQDKLLKKAKYIVSLFPVAANHYSRYYNRADIRRIAGHIINTDRVNQDIDSLVLKKAKSNKILFIGRKKYKAGAKCLIKAISQYNQKNTSDPLKVIIIGMDYKELDIEANPCVNCVEYLDKSIPEHNNKYYEYIGDAKIIVNTTKNWGGISSIVEAMYFCTPVITSKYSDFVEIFGENLEFGTYCEPENEIELFEKISNIVKLSFADYEKLCLAAFKEVNAFTWSANINTLIP